MHRRQPPVRRPAVSLAAVLLAVFGLAGCAGRATVAPDQARDLLTTAVGMAASGQMASLCSLSPADASTCPDSLIDYGPELPTAGPMIVCEVAAPDVGPLRHGRILVVAGVDGAGVEYVTEFVVYDNGDSVGVLDAVFWNGLTIESYSSDTVTWRFDSTTDTCDNGGLIVSE